MAITNVGKTWRMAPRGDGKLYTVDETNTRNGIFKTLTFETGGLNTHSGDHNTPDPARINEVWPDTHLSTPPHIDSGFHKSLDFPQGVRPVTGEPTWFQTGQAGQRVTDTHLDCRVIQGSFDMSTLGLTPEIITPRRGNHFYINILRWESRYDNRINDYNGYDGPPPERWVSLGGSTDGNWVPYTPLNKPRGGVQFGQAIAQWKPGADVWWCCSMYVPISFEVENEKDVMNGREIGNFTFDVNSTAQSSVSIYPTVWNKNDTECSWRFDFYPLIDTQHEINLETGQEVNGQDPSSYLVGKSEFVHDRGHWIDWIWHMVQHPTNGVFEMWKTAGPDQKLTKIINHFGVVGPGAPDPTYEADPPRISCYKHNWHKADPVDVTSITGPVVLAYDEYRFGFTANGCTFRDVHPDQDYETYMVFPLSTPTSLGDDWDGVTLGSDGQPLPVITNPFAQWRVISENALNGSWTHGAGMEATWTGTRTAETPTLTYEVINYDTNYSSRVNTYSLFFYAAYPVDPYGVFANVNVTNPDATYQPINIFDLGGTFTFYDGGAVQFDARQATSGTAYVDFIIHDYDGANDYNFRYEWVIPTVARTGVYHTCTFEGGGINLVDSWQNNDPSRDGETWPLTINPNSNPYPDSAFVSCLDEPQTGGPYPDFAYSQVTGGGANQCLPTDGQDVRVVESIQMSDYGHTAELITPRSGSYFMVQELFYNKVYNPINADDPVYSDNLNKPRGGITFAGDDLTGIHRWKEGSEMWFGWSMYVPNSFEVENGQSSRDARKITFCEQDIYNGGSSGTGWDCAITTWNKADVEATWAFALHPGGGTGSSTDWNLETGFDENGADQTAHFVNFSNFADDRGQWTDWVVHYQQSETAGIMEVWKTSGIGASRAMTKIIEYQGTAIGPTPDPARYAGPPRFQSYKYGWKYSNTGAVQPTTVGGPIVIGMDEWRMGFAASGAGFSDVAPGD